MASDEDGARQIDEAAPYNNLSEEAKRHCSAFLREAAKTQTVVTVCVFQAQNGKTPPMSWSVSNAEGSLAWTAPRFLVAARHEELEREKAEQEQTPEPRSATVH